MMIDDTENNPRTLIFFKEQLSHADLSFDPSASSPTPDEPQACSTEKPSATPCSSAVPIVAGTGFVTLARRAPGGGGFNSDGFPPAT